MMGTGDFAVPTFRLLIDRGYPVRHLVTQPDRPQGRHQQLMPAAIKTLAIERDIEVFQPESVNTPESIERLAALEPDLLVVAAYGQILSDDLLSVPRLGGINLHASLLPKYRGAAPINWAIYHGETVTGVTVIQITPRVDAGAILLQAETPIGPAETSGELEARLAEMGATLICRAIDGLATGALTGRPQDRSQATRAPKLKKEHGLIDWTRSVTEIYNHIRAMQPWPLAYTYLHRARGGVPERIIIERVTATLANHEWQAGMQPKPGQFLEWSTETDRRTRLHVCTGTGIGLIVVERLRPAGKKSMTAEEFLRGNPIELGDRFGLESMP
jgi:methionyl-tRNA formyltransferase